MSKSVSVNELISFFEAVLTQSPSEAGKRLCSERELALKLDIGRMKIQRAFDFLVEEGILVRRQGSGTYIRKVPSLRKRIIPQALQDRSFSASDMLAAPGPEPVRYQPPRERRRLTIALMVNADWDNEANRAIVSGILARGKQEKHNLLIYTGQEKAGDASQWSLAKKLQETSFDGCLLWTTYQSILEKAYGDKFPPVVFIGTGTRESDLRFAPVVRINLEEAIVRALNILAESGYKKIGFIGFGDPLRGGYEERLYQDTISKLGLSFQKSALAQLDDAETLRLAKKMFFDSDPPEAVYVADDIVLKHLVPAFRKLNIVPGRDVAIITLACRNEPLPAGIKWSRMEFHPFQVGRMAMDSLLLEIQTAGESICSFEHVATWVPGTTHLCRPA